MEIDIDIFEYERNLDESCHALRGSVQPTKGKRDPYSTDVCAPSYIVALFPRWIT